MKVLSIGEVLWDMLPDGAHLGGAPFNLAANCARLGHEALLLTAVGEDARGDAALEGIRAAGVSIEFVQRTDSAATGVVRVEFDREGQPDYTIVRPAAYDFLRAGRDLVAGLAARSPQFVCFGSLSQLYPNNREVAIRAIAGVPRVLKFLDVNLRRNSYDRELLGHLMAVADLVKFNEAETATIQELFGTAEPTLERFCRAYAKWYGWRGACVTRGALGCAVSLDGEFATVSGFPVEIEHPVGAGDAFSAGFCHGLAAGWSAAQIGEFANRVGAVAASRVEAAGDWNLEDCYKLARAASG
jgi:fructokinase